MEKNDTDEIKKKTESLQEVAMRLDTKVYEQANKDGQANETDGADQKDKKDDVEEASYEEK